MLDDGKDASRCAAKPLGRLCAVLPKSKVKGRIIAIEIYIKPEEKAVCYVVSSKFSDTTDL